MSDLLARLGARVLVPSPAVRPAIASLFLAPSSWPAADEPPQPRETAAYLDDPPAPVEGPVPRRAAASAAALASTSAARWTRAVQVADAEDGEPGRARAATRASDAPMTPREDTRPAPAERTGPAPSPSGVAPASGRVPGPRAAGPRDGAGPAPPREPANRHHEVGSVEPRPIEPRPSPWPDGLRGGTHAVAAEGDVTEALTRLRRLGAMEVVRRAPSEPAPTERIVRISIGRIEVRALPAAAPPPSVARPRQPARPRRSLADYLARKVHERP